MKFLIALAAIVGGAVANHPDDYYYDSYAPYVSSRSSSSPYRIEFGSSRGGSSSRSSSSSSSSSSRSSSRSSRSSSRSSRSPYRIDISDDALKRLANAEAQVVPEAVVVEEVVVEEVAPSMNDVQLNTCMQQNEWLNEAVTSLTMELDAQKDRQSFMARIGEKNQQGASDYKLQVKWLEETVETLTEQLEGMAIALEISERKEENCSRQGQKVQELERTVEALTEQLIKLTSQLVAAYEGN